jgi:hypothetical protein
MNDGDLYEMIGLQKTTVHGKPAVIVSESSDNTQYDAGTSMVIVARQLINEDALWEQFVPVGVSQNFANITSPVICKSKLRIFGAVSDVVPGHIYLGGKDHLYRLGLHFQPKKCIDYAFHPSAGMMICWLGSYTFFS